MAGVPNTQWTAPAPPAAGAGAGPALVAAPDFTREEKEAIQRCLSLHLGPEYITYRPAPTGGKVAYIEGWRALELANETFGFSGWSSSVQDMAVDFVRGAAPLAARWPQVTLRH
jgi:recombination DNA repair RAD52 pathway protein